ncbi:hypothetical protein GYA19_05790 [Candidatus Beckwithbacteria bacterium]|nr:hypothetical protein [Candidatus Beckwithbacteria bacterium]
MTDNSLPLPEIVAIDIAKPLKIKVDQITKFLTKSIGDHIQTDDIIALKKSFVGIGKTVIKSPMSGVIVNIDQENGTIILKTGEEKVAEEKIDNVDPEPSEIKQEEKKEIKEDKKTKTKDKEKKKSAKTFMRPSKVQEEEKETEVDSLTLGFGNCQGIAWVLEEEFDQKSIIPEMKEKILIIRNLPNSCELFKASAVGVYGIVALSDNTDEAYQICRKFADKIHLAFMVLPAETKVSRLHNKQLEIKGRERELIIIS